MNRSNTVPTAIAFIIFVGLIIGGVLYLSGVVSRGKEKTYEETLKNIGTLPDIQIKMNGIYYRAKSNISYATQNFIKNFPLSVEMSDENSNQKKGCVYFKFDGDADKPKNIEKGDLLIYGDSCIVIATDDFAGYGSYKKIGHIEKMPDLPDGSYLAIFSEAGEVK
jgi:hypothetical protein